MPICPHSLSHPGPRKPLIYFLSPYISMKCPGHFIEKEFHNLWSCVWLLSLRVVFLRFTYVVVCVIPLYCWLVFRYTNVATCLSVTSVGFWLFPAFWGWGGCFCFSSQITLRFISVLYCSVHLLHTISPHDPFYQSGKGFKY